jgi:NADH-quinone oxidoreductase subunit H
MEIAIILLETLIKAVLVIGIILTAAAVLVYAERKVSAFIQNRIGPNRVGPFGVLQPFADVIKLFMKEDLVPKAADKNFHRIAPIISLGVAVALYAVIPFANYITIDTHKIYMGIAPDLNIGILYILAMTSVGVYGLTLAGWSSNSKYSLLGGLRSSAQMISYELSMGLSIVGVIMITGSLSMNNIILHQEGWRWNILFQPLGFIIFLVSSFAETSRAPFDLPEAEPELVGGYNTEYSGMKFGMFFLAEYANMATSSAIITLLFLGGWQFPFIYDWFGFSAGSIELAALQFLVFSIKIGILVFVFIWIRWTVPRFRYDQLMRLGWKVLLPLALINVVLTGLGLIILK